MLLMSTHVHPEIFYYYYYYFVNFYVISASYEVREGRACELALCLKVLLVANFNVDHEFAGLPGGLKLMQQQHIPKTPTALFLPPKGNPNR